MDPSEQDTMPLRPQKSKEVDVTVSYLSPDAQYPAPSIRSMRSGEIPRHHFWKKPTGENLFWLAFDIVFALVPCIFILLAVAAIAVNDQPYRSGRSAVVYEAARIAPTIFPIVFAAVVGRLMRNYALWRAENGDKLGFIEQLHGSQNLVCALERAYLIPGLGMAGALVVLLWCMSPLGGQSSTRVLVPEGRLNLTHGTDNVYYYNSSAIADASGLSGSRGSALASYNMNGILTASLLSILQVKGQDLWGNVKVPFLESAIAYNGNKMTSGWYDLVDYAESNLTKSGAEFNTSYSSLSGIVTGIFDKSVTHNYTMDNTYYNLTCEPPAIFMEDEEFMRWAGTMYTHTNISLLWNTNPNNTDPFGDMGRSFLVDTNWQGSFSTASDGSMTSVASASDPFNIIYASHWTGNYITAFNCNVAFTHVELNIFADDSGPHVRGMRPSPNTHLYTNFLPFWASENSFTYVQGLLSYIQYSIPNPMPALVSVLDSYIAGSDHPFSYDSPIFPTNDSSLIATRLSRLLNTGWQSSFQQSSLVTTPNPNESLWLDATDISFIFNTPKLDFPTTLTISATESSSRVNAINTIWVILTIALSVLLFICGLLSLIAKYKTFAPDVLGFVSSMARDNPNFEKIPRSEQLDGLEYARKMGHVRVQLDLGSWEDDNQHITLRNLGHARG